MTMTKEVLMKAKALIAERGWTQRSYGKLSNGQPAFDDGLDGKDGACFCAVGAIYAVVGGIRNADHPAIVALAKEIDGESAWEGTVLVWNDRLDRTKDEVLDLFARAIASCDAEPQP